MRKLFFAVFAFECDVIGAFFHCDTFLTDEQVNQLSLYAPDATVNRIDNYDVVGKSRPSLPERIESVLVCPNSNCISHAEPVSSSFAVKKRLPRSTP